MKLADYGIWFDVMSIDSVGPAMTNAIQSSSFIIPYDLEHLKLIIDQYHDVIDVAVIVYGTETTNSWLLTDDKILRQVRLQEIEVFMARNTVAQLKYRYPV